MSKADPDSEVKLLGKRMGDFGGKAREAGLRDGWRPTGRQALGAMTKAEQDELLGPDVAEAVRKGEVSLRDLVTRNHTDTDGEDFITQAPAKDLGISTESDEDDRRPDQD